MLNKLRSKKGFTLVEILVVILIIGILFVAFLPRIDFAGDKARETNVKTDMRTFMVAAEQLFKENSGLPVRVDSASSDTSPTPLELLTEDSGKNVTQINKLLDPTLQVALNGNTLKSALKDPWAEPYRVDMYSNYPATNKQAIVITSHGKGFGSDGYLSADYGAIIIYEKGHVSSCTFGLNQNIGTVEGITEVANVGFTVAATGENGIGTLVPADLKCN